MAKQRGLRSHLWCAKRDARNRGIAWQIKDADAIPLFTQPCYYCGRLPNPVNGIDRRNNEKFYRKSNALPCCWPCNRQKSATRESEWLAHVEGIFSHSIAPDMAYWDAEMGIDD